MHYNLAPEGDEYAFKPLGRPDELLCEVSVESEKHDDAEECCTSSCRGRRMSKQHSGDEIYLRPTLANRTEPYDEVRG